MRKKIIQYSLLFLIFSLSAVVSCKKNLGIDLSGLNTPHPPAHSHIQIEIFFGEFRPEEIQIQVGDTIEWTTNYPGGHSVVADDSSFYSNEISYTNPYHRVFNETGTYNYYCGFHPELEKGTVTVIKR
jgi:plastocyanin